MEKQVFIINGSGGVGKDTFVNFVSTQLLLETNGKYSASNYTSISRVMSMAKIAGFVGAKTERDRKFLSDLKSLLIEYNDSPFMDIKTKIYHFMNNDNDSNIVLFIHIREPEEIERVVKMYSFVKTILVTRDSIDDITSNDSDKNVYDYNYDYMINNKGSLKEFRKSAKTFVKKEILPYIYSDSDNGYRD